MVKRTNNSKMLIYAVSFMASALLGWIYEVLIVLAFHSRFENRGFLFGPYLPVYGFGAVVLFYILDRIRRNKKTDSTLRLKPFIVFFAAVLIATAIELPTGIFLEKALHLRLWDYRDDWMNLNGYISPWASLRFGIGGILFFYLIRPVVKKICGYFTEKSGKILIFILCTVIVLDLILSIVLKYRI